MGPTAERHAGTREAGDPTLEIGAGVSESQRYGSADVGTDANPRRGGPRSGPIRRSHGAGVEKYSADNAVEHRQAKNDLDEIGN
ncbi:hypothetical protein PSA01_54580 [Pseudonocardia saturnea]|uniref:Uncharacterized protein n=1 Tax=Pseudonocardia saturnea TaxID=33909 RepID=A0ABQ0S697_9PSEU|nr:hypothetical protein Pdca_15990 [Pseudonocardia autotrophica]GEC28429.1 hypothetical protein PSA01_54580 [Pseudonocardia saturnea]